MGKQEYVITIDGEDYTNIGKASRVLQTHDAPMRAIIVSLKYGSKTKDNFSGHVVEYKRGPDKPVHQLVHIVGTPLLAHRPLGWYGPGRGEA